MLISLSCSFTSISYLTTSCSFTLILHLSVMLVSLSCSLTSISFLTKSCSFTLIKYHLSWPSNYCNIKIQLNLVVFDYKSVTNTYQGWRFEQTIEWNSKKGYGCKWKWETIQFYTWTQIKVKEQLLVRKDMDVNEHERLTNITLRYKIKVKEQLVVRIDILSHYKLFLYSNFISKCNVSQSLMFIYIYILSHYKLFLYFNSVNEHERLTNITLRHTLK
jgi:hypothetical protein